MEHYSTESYGGVKLSAMISRRPMPGHIQSTLPEGSIHTLYYYVLPAVYQVGLVSY